MRVERLLETAIYGSDLGALEPFYVELLGGLFPQHDRPYRAARAIPAP